MVAFALMAALVIEGCDRASEPAHVDVGDLSVVVVMLDAAGARHLSAYGNPLPTSPSIDTPARDGGTIFMRAYAQAAWTPPSTASFLTGRYPRRRKQTRTVVQGDTLASIMQRAGFVTAAFSENPYVTSTFGFDHGFDAFHEYFPKALFDAAPRHYATDSERPTTDAPGRRDATTGTLRPGTRLRNAGTSPPSSPLAHDAWRVDLALHIRQTARLSRAPDVGDDTAHKPSATLTSPIVCGNDARSGICGSAAG